MLTRTESNSTLLAAARATVVAVNTLASWAPENGFCMSWPPVRVPLCYNAVPAAISPLNFELVQAVRIMEAANASWVLDGMAQALGNTMYNNFYPQVRGAPVLLNLTTVAPGQMRCASI